jgi:hypothetical protein
MERKGRSKRRGRVASGRHGGARDRHERRKAVAISRPHAVKSIPGQGSSDAIPSKRGKGTPYRENLTVLTVFKESM